MKLLHTLLRFARNRSGATAIEYTLIAGLIGVAIVGGATLLGGSTNGAFTAVSDGVWSAAPPAAP